MHCPNQKIFRFISLRANRGEADAYLTANDLTAEIPVFTCDATAIKTAARADPTLYLLKKGTILNKWSYADLESAHPGTKCAFNPKLLNLCDQP